MYRAIRKLLWFLLWLMILILFLNYVSEHTAHAEVVKPKALGGLAKYIDDFYERGNRFYEEEDLRLLSAIMELENGGGTDRCLLLTGSVLLNRAYYCSWCPDTIEGCIYQGYKGHGQQYASHTVENLYTVKISDRVTELAKQLLIFGVVCPHNVVYQSRYAHQGSGNYEVINGEYFAYE